MSDNLHAAVCNAVAIMNTSIDIARSPEGRKARDILRQALIDYAEEYMDQSVTEQEREQIARKHRAKQKGER
jgi:hypothetical protein